MDFNNTNIRTSREKLLADPYRPAYHFVVPDGDEVLSPNDPNGAFYADGLYHLMYLYRNSVTDGHHWGHMVSKDLLHFRHLPDALGVHEGDMGCFSGGAFVDEDKTAYLSFWKLFRSETDAHGVALACAKPPYVNWERVEHMVSVSGKDLGIQDVEIDGKILHLGSCDPSNIWKENGWYYIQLGNKPVLDKYGMGEDADPMYQGGWTELYRSKDLKHWEFLHRFYDVPCDGKNDWPDETEDDMCPQFLPLYDARENGNKTGKWIQLFISHNKGCQYFVGEWKNEKFYPETHGRMSWRDITYFAPEALMDDRNRMILWTWLKDNLEPAIERFGWRGVYGLPRLLWWQEDMLRIAPADELEALQYNQQSFTKAGKLPVKNGETFRLQAVFDTGEGAGVRVRESADGTEFTEIYYDADAKALVVDTTHSGTEGDMKGKESAPFVLQEGEALNLDIFVDKSVVEVFANERQAIARRIFPTKPETAIGVTLLTDAKVDVWEMMPTNPY